MDAGLAIFAFEWERTQSESGVVGSATCTFAAVAAQSGQPAFAPFNLLKKHTNDSELQLVTVRKHLPNVLELPPISHHGNVNEIIGKSGGADQLRTAINHSNRCCMRRGLTFNN